MYYKLLRIREQAILIYKKYEYLLNFIFKFIVGYFVFNKIAGIGLNSEKLNVFFRPGVLSGVSILFGVFFSLMPLSLSYFVLLILVAASFSASVEVSFLVFIGLLLILFFYARIANRESILILGTILAFYFKIPYAVPVLAGIYFGITSFIPVSIGVFLWNSYPIAYSIAQKGAALGSDTGLKDLLAVPKNLYNVYIDFLAKITTNQVWLIQCLVFSMVIIFVYFISRFAFDYAKEVAIVLGVMLNVIGFLIAAVISGAEISVVSVFFSSIFCLIIVAVIKFFDNVLDYPNSEKVEFEDDEYYYYVKAVPKIVKLKINKGLEKQIKEKNQKPKTSLDKKEPLVKREKEAAERETSDKKVVPIRKDNLTKIANEKREAFKNKINTQKINKSQPKNFKSSKKNKTITKKDNKELEIKSEEKKDGTSGGK